MTDTAAAPGSIGSVRVKLRYFSSVGAAAGRNEEEIELPRDCTVFELMETLSNKYGRAFRDEIFLRSETALRDDLIISIDGVVADHTRAKKSAVGSGANIDLFTTFPGGG